MNDRVDTQSSVTAVSRRLAAAQRRLTGGGSARSLARKTKLHHSYVSKILKGERRPSIQVVDVIAGALGIPLDDCWRRLQALWKVTGQPTPQPWTHGRKGGTKTKTARSPRAARR